LGIANPLCRSTFIIELEKSISILIVNNNMISLGLLKKAVKEGIALVE
jgi:hypothetical protein